MMHIITHDRDLDLYHEQLIVTNEEVMTTEVPVIFVFVKILPLDKQKIFFPCHLTVIFACIRESMII